MKRLGIFLGIMFVSCSSNRMGIISPAVANTTIETSDYTKPYTPLFIDTTAVKTPAPAKAIYKKEFVHEDESLSSRLDSFSKQLTDQTALIQNQTDIIQTERDGRLRAEQEARDEKIARKEYELKSLQKQDSLQNALNAVRDDLHTMRAEAKLKEQRSKLWDFIEENSVLILCGISVFIVVCAATAATVFKILEDVNLITRKTA